MKSALVKSALREIKKTKNRFFSIFGIVAIGVGFFSGVKASAPDMRLSADKYYDEQNLMDFRLVSTYGFDKNDIAALKEKEGAEVYPSYYTDVLSVSEGATPDAARVFALIDNESLNTVKLMSGRMPEAADECIISASDMNGSWLEIGTKVTFTDENGGQPDDMLNRFEYTVVGTFMSPMLVDKTSYGSTSVGSGSVGAVFYVPKENFCAEYNTEVYLRFPYLSDYLSYSDKYTDEIDRLTDELEAVAESRQDRRYNEIMDEANETLDEAKRELADAEAEAEAEIADGEKELAEARDKLDEAKAEIDDGWAEIEKAEKDLADGEKELADAKKDIDEGWEEIRSGEQELADARAELDQGYIDLADGRAEYEKEISAAEKELADGEKEIADNEKKLNEGEAEYETGLAEFNAGYERFLEGKKQYEDGVLQYEAGYKQLKDSEAGLEKLKYAYGENSTVYISAKAKYDEGVAVLEATKLQLDETKKLLDENEAQIEQGRAELEAAKAEIDSGREQLNQAKKTLEDGKAELEAEKAKAEKEFSEAEAELADGEKQYEDGLKELEDGKRELIDGEKDYNDGLAEYYDGLQEIEDARRELTDGEKEYADGLIEYEDGVKELEDGKAEAEEKIADAKAELADAEEELADLEKPEWYIFNRNDNPGYSEYGENANRVENIAAVFPVFFIVVAALVCLTTMSRMVEEQRTQIGTLKALGYKNSEIIFKYMFYAAAAGLTGALTGVLAGMQLFPIVIVLAYRIMYNVPTLCTPIDLPTAAASVIVTLAAILLTVFFTCKSALSEHAAQLMRPKAPKMGKRILLERIKPIWKRLNFSNKVTARNLFRYKRKMLMSTIGIAGCTALLLTGFALYDSVNDIIRLQYGEIQFYDGFVVYDGEKYPEADEKAADIISEYGESVNVYQKQMKVSANERDVDAYIAVPSDPEKFADFFSFRDRKTGEKYTLSDGEIFIDEKMSILLDNVSAGDVLSVSKSDTEEIDVTLTAYFENYPGHYVYMTENTYADLFGEKPEYNTLYFSHNLGEEGEDGLAEEILKNDGILTVSFSTALKSSYKSMLDTLGLVIVVIIISAGALAYIVMYNLTNINITERIREIATLKVLGFYDKEVDGYIFRENILLTLLGTAAGLIMGVFLAMFVITTAEVDLVMFGRNIYLKSYLLAALFTLLFSALVTLVMHKRLENVDMIEALKSIE